MFKKYIVSIGEKNKTYLRLGHTMSHSYTNEWQYASFSDSLEQANSWLNIVEEDIRRNRIDNVGSTPEIIELQINFVNVQMDFIREIDRQCAMNKLTDYEKRILGLIV